MKVFLIAVAAFYVVYLVLFAYCIITAKEEDEEQ